MKKLLSFLLLTTLAVSLQADRPNVVLVITDDQGYGDLSCHGNPILKTPALDALHSESVRLTDYHVAPTCSPTRCALLTGHWTNRTGVWHTIMGRSMLRENEVTVAQMLSDGGYATGMFGKWHLGDNYPYRPEDRGFTEVYRHGGGGVGQTPDVWNNAYFDGAYWHNGKIEPAKGFCTDVFFQKAIEFIDDSAEKKKPFFAYIASNAPHGPMHAPEYYSRPYEELGVGVANFFGMIANIDDNVARLRAHLKAKGLEENTIFIFTTDNGTSSGAKVFNAGMRGQKGSNYEGGHRVPFFIHWPEGGLTSGRDVDTITSYVDIVPTLLDYTGVSKPTDVKFDGVSIRPLIDGKAKNWKHRYLVTDSQRVKDPIKWKTSAVMDENWRLINGKELYDINTDPGQTKNVAGKHEDVVGKMRKFYEDWWAELEPTFSQTTEIYLGHPADNPARLTSHDWITTKISPWNQRHIRQAFDAKGSYGFWAVKVVEGGEYEIEVRRWPKEADHPITASMEAGADVPGQPAYRAIEGKAITADKAVIMIGGKEYSQPVPKNAKSVTFSLPLKKGKDQLYAKFVSKDGKEIGAYYAYVKKK